MACANAYCRRSWRLFETLALARLLSPSELRPVWNWAVIATNTLDLFSEAGLKSAVIQKKQEKSSEDLDTAWTVLLIQAVTNVLLLCAISGFVAHFFHQPRATLSHSRAFACAVLLEGFVNIGIIYFDRNLHFQKRYQFVLAGAVSRSYSCSRRCLFDTQRICARRRDYSR